ncbi:MAG: PHP domain-containing protein [Candidatus Omnitrophota bacterium]|nr:PHP domain-containing protein [Candidatus Omnitrophota bacterium]
MKYADLHIHTFYSDSTFSPEEVVATASNKALAAIAICDHDSIDGIGPCTELGLRSGVEIVPGIELTVEKPDAEIHLLGYFIDWEQEWLRKRLKEIQGIRIERIHKMVAKLAQENVRMDAGDVFKISGKGSVGRMHLAQAMLRTGKIKRLKEAFDKYIGFLKPCYVSNIAFTPQEAIGLILKAGGVPVLAHPGIMCKDEHIPELIGYGLKGIEVYHTDHTPTVTRHYEEIAKMYGLLASGGSDCHGLGKGRVLIGTTRVPYELVDKLKAEADRIKAENRK